MKIFIDVNVILDFLDEKRARHSSACQLFEILGNCQAEILISEDILTNVFYINKDKLAVLYFFKSVQQKWTFAVFGNQVISKAIDLALDKNLDLEDTLQCLCAKENQCDVLITNDTYFYDCGVNIQTVNEFLNA